MEYSIEKSIEKFKDYASNFDLNNEMIKRKYYHTFRVLEYAQDIAKSNNLDEHDYYIASICALLHDISRFLQAKEYGTYLDSLSFDHGDKGYEILLENDFIFEFVDNDEDRNIVLKAVRYHNKYNLEYELTDKEWYFSKLVRDADKLDIMDKQGINISDNSLEVPDEFFDAIKEKRLVRRNSFTNWTDIMTVISTLCFIYNIEFERSFEIIKEKQIVKRKIDELEKCLDLDKIQFIKDNFSSFI